MSFDIDGMTAIELRQLVLSRKISPVELTRRALQKVPVELRVIAIQAAVPGFEMEHLMPEAQ